MRPSEAESAYAVMCMTLDQYYDRSVVDFFLLQWPRGQIVAVDFDGSVMGYLAGSRLQNGRASVALLCVAPGSQGRGVGTALVRRFMEQARMEGIRTVQLEVRPENKRAVRLYERLGFMAVENLPGFYNDGGAGLRMVASTSQAGPNSHRSYTEWT